MSCYTGKVTTLQLAGIHARILCSQAVASPFGVIQNICEMSVIHSPASKYGLYYLTKAIQQYEFYGANMTLLDCARKYIYVFFS